MTVELKNAKLDNQQTAYCVRLGFIMYVLGGVKFGLLTAQAAELGTVVENVLVCTVTPRLGPAGIASTILVLVHALLCQPTA